MFSIALTYEMEDLTTNNDPPSNAAMEEVKRALSIPLQNIVEIDAEILDLEKRLHNLRGKRAENEVFVERYGAVLAPIRRLPRDVLCEIFYRCLATHRNPIMKSTECPILLTRVCSTWRAIAMAEPRLWSRVYITCAEDDSRSDSTMADSEMDLFPALPVPPMMGGSPFFGGPQSRFRRRRPMLCSVPQPPHALRLKCDAVKEWLSRSGELPLSISIFFTDNFIRKPFLDIDSRPIRTTECKVSRGHIHELFQVLAALSPRLADLEFQMSIEIYRELEGMLDVSKMKQLTSLRARFQSHTPGNQLGRITPISLLKGPNLRKVSMFAHNAGLWGLFEPTCACIWDKLTDISCHNTLSIEEIALLLIRSPNLVHFKAFMVQYVSTANSVTRVSDDSQISLPYLLTFSLTDNCDPGDSERLYKRIDAPALKQIIYIGDFAPRSRLRMGLPTSTHPIPILPLLFRSTQLKQLVIDSTTGSKWDIKALLRAIPRSVTHLVIGSELGRHDESLHRAFSMIYEYSLHLASGRSANQMVDLEDLVFTMPANCMARAEPPLLPSLQSFKISSGAIALNEEHLLEFITSRMNHPQAAEASHVANLKRVSIVFHHKRQCDLDVAAQVQQHATRVGVDMIDLSLEYPKESDRLECSSNPAAPDFGLGEADGRSWCHTDAGEYGDWM